jgi:hypothetical protein
MEAWEMLDAIQRSWVPVTDYVDPWWLPPYEPPVKRGEWMYVHPYTGFKRIVADTAVNGW